MPSSYIIGLNSCQARGVQCCGLEVVRDFLQKVAFELGIEEWGKFWGRVFQAEA